MLLISVSVMVCQYVTDMFQSWYVSMSLTTVSVVVCQYVTDICFSHGMSVTSPSVPCLHCAADAVTLLSVFHAYFVAMNNPSLLGFPTVCLQCITLNVTVAK